MFCKQRGTVIPKSPMIIRFNEVIFMEAKETFGDRLRDLRNISGISQKVLCNDLGISKAALSYYENGQRVPDIDILLNIAKRFNVSADYLLGRTSVKTTDIDLKAVCEYIGLSENAVTKIRSAISKDVKSSVLYEGIIVDVLDYIDKLKGETK